MEAEKIAKGNLVFYLIVAGADLCSESFENSVISSLNKESELFHVEDQVYPGYIGIDSSAVSNSDGDTKKKFMHLLKNCCLLGRISLKVTDSISGDMNTDVSIEVDDFLFDFKIAWFERSRENEFELLDDASSIPEGELIGRHVDLVISPVMPKE